MRTREFRRAASCGLVAYLITSVPIAVALLLAVDCRAGALPRVNWASVLNGGDGKFYTEIAMRGYSYNEEDASNVAFFPAYPIAARMVARLIATPAAIALPFTSNCCCAAAFVAMFWYGCKRRASAEFTGGRPCGDHTVLAVLAIGLMPTTFYFRMAYSEAMFVLGTIVSMQAIAVGLHPVLAALIVGFTTATRPVGVALLAPLAAYAWRRSKDRRSGIANVGCSLAIGTWGLAAFMLFQYLEFGDSLAFARTQAHYSLISASVGDKIMSLVSGTPFWSVYDDTSPGYWRRFRAGCALLNLQAAQPFYFIGTAALIWLGGCSLAGAPDSGGLSGHVAGNRRKLMLIKRAPFGENNRFSSSNFSRWERTPVNQSIRLGLLATSASANVRERLERCSREAFDHVLQLVGSFFGRRPLTRRGFGV